MRNRKTILALALLLVCLPLAGFRNCSRTQQPKSVADVLTEIGKTKRNMKAQGLITAQQDADITRKLIAANEAYTAYVASELTRTSTNPNARPDSQKIMALHVALLALQNPANFGITNPTALALWQPLAELLTATVARIH